MFIGHSWNQTQICRATGIVSCFALVNRLVLKLSVDALSILGNMTQSSHARGSVSRVECDKEKNSLIKEQS